ncbi:dihydropteroate synthase [Escherichia coli]|uniref:dihydropteroate synthase n=1 Tax=Escherichia coli TaxID=562 RepID=UPI001CC82CA0|nr:dihydropteroate synthase [Escherichia coli]
MNKSLIIFGIVNITSDSFSDGGRYLAPDAAIAQARKLMAEGADVIDLGPASSNPDAAPVSSDTEIARIAPVLDALKADGIPVSLDSYQPATQAYALSRGVAYLNDIRGFPDAAFYPQLAKSSAKLVVILGAICGTAGVALLVLTPNAALDPVGVAAGLAGAVSMAFGTVLTRKWQPPVPLLTFTAWQLAAGGLLLVPVALVFDPPIPMPTGTNVLGLAWLGLIGAGLTYFLWFRGISRLEPTVVSLLGFLSPGTAVLLGWLFLDQTLSALQIIGVLLVIGSIWLGQRSNRTPRARIACRKSP